MESVATGATTTKKQSWGRMPGDGRVVELYTLQNRNGVRAVISSYGATLVSLIAPDSQGICENIVLGYDDLAGYLAGKDYFGATIGRYANRIGGGRYTLDGKAYVLSQNEGANTLHGGCCGFDKKMWSLDTLAGDNGGESVRCELRSDDGEEGFPGSVIAHVTYTLSDMNELRLDYGAVSDRDTVINLTNHSYFNLSLSRARDVLNHELTINSDLFLPVDDKLIPTGQFACVRDSPFDFRQSHAIGSRIDCDDEQLRFAKGYDHTWVLEKPNRQALAWAATLFERESGRVIDIATTEPGIQFYSGNFLKRSPGSFNNQYGQHAGLCLETQHFPDSPNKPQFPSVVLKKGHKYMSATTIRLGLI